jgi:CheY-like chemotaxis protein
VLVADDELAIQELLVRVLSGLGFVALVVPDGTAAIAAVEAHRDDLICAVLDIVMPLVNGVDAALAIQVIAPDLAIVLMSGAIPAHCADGIARLRLAGMLSKPFPLATLREMIQHTVEIGVAHKTIHPSADIERPSVQAG